MKILGLILLIGILLSACASPETPPPLPMAEQTLPESAQATATVAVPSQTPAPSLTSTVTSHTTTPTGMALPFVKPGAKIVAENASQLQEVGDWISSSWMNAQFLPGMDKIALMLEDPLVLYDPQSETNTQLMSWPAPDSGWTNPGAVFSPDGSLVAWLRGSCPAEGMRCQIEVQPREGGPSLFTLETDVLSALAISTDNRFMVIGGIEGLAVYSLEDGSLVTLLPESIFFDRVAISPDGTRLAGFVYMSEYVNVWTLPVGELVYRLEPQAYRGVFYPNNVAFSPDGKILAVGANGLIGLWQATDGEEIRFWQPHNSEIGSLAFSPDGLLIASADWNGNLVISEVSSGQVIYSSQISDGMIWRVGFVTSGAFLATFDHTGNMRLWGIPAD